jgi:hypothetical protein
MLKNAKCNEIIYIIKTMFEIIINFGVVPNRTLGNCTLGSKTLLEYEKTQALHNCNRFLTDSTSGVN